MTTLPWSSVVVTTAPLLEPLRMTEWPLGRVVVSAACWVSLTVERVEVCVLALPLEFVVFITVAGFVAVLVDAAPFALVVVVLSTTDVSAVDCRAEVVLVIVVLLDVVVDVTGTTTWVVVLLEVLLEVLLLVVGEAKKTCGQPSSG